MIDCGLFRPNVNYSNLRPVQAHEPAPDAFLCAQKRRHTCRAATRPSQAKKEASKGATGPTGFPSRRHASVVQVAGRDAGLSGNMPVILSKRRGSKSSGRNALSCAQQPRLPFPAGAWISNMRKGLRKCLALNDLQSSPEGLNSAWLSPRLSRIQSSWRSTRFVGESQQVVGVDMLKRGFSGLCWAGLRLAEP